MKNNLLRRRLPLVIEGEALSPIFMNRQQLIDDIKYIKEVISSSIHYTNLSGIAAVISGITTIVGCWLSRLILGQWYIASPEINFVIYPLAGVWICVFLISALAHVIFIGRKAKKTCQPAWTRVAKVIVYALCPPLVVGAFMTLFLVHENQILWIPGIWMICFGLGVWSAGLFSIREPRWLGAIFIVAGLATLFLWQEQSLFALGFSFGLCHLLYGIRLYYKYGEG